MAFKAELLREKLQEEGKTRADLARATRRNVRTVSRWLRGENAPKAKDLEAIAQALDCRPQDFDPFFASTELEEVSIQAHVSVASHNAYELMAWRYEVTQKQIMELAPILFAIVAGHALKVPEQNDAYNREAARLGLDHHRDLAWHIHEKASKEMKCFGIKVPEAELEHGVVHQNLFCEAIRRLSFEIQDYVRYNDFVGAGPQDVPTAAGYVPDIQLLEAITAGDPVLIEALVKGRVRFSKCYEELQKSEEKLETAEDISKALSSIIQRDLDKSVEEKRRKGLVKLEAWRAFYAERHPDLAQEYDNLVSKYCHEEGWSPRECTEDDKRQIWINPYKEDRHIDDEKLPEYHQKKAEIAASGRDPEELFWFFSASSSPIFGRLRKLQQHRLEIKKQFEEVWT